MKKRPLSDSDHLARLHRCQAEKLKADWWDNAHRPGDLRPHPDFDNPASQRHLKWTQSKAAASARGHLAQAAAWEEKARNE